MRLVESAERLPHHCMVYPQLGQCQREGYVDTGSTVTVMDPRVYISVCAVKDMAALIGLPRVEEFEAVVGERDRLARELEECRAALDSAERLVEAVDVLESRDFRARKKPGRPRKEVSEDA